MNTTPIYIDAAPILAELYKRADQPKGKNPYENIKIATYKKALELLLNAPVADLVKVGQGCYCSVCRFRGTCATRELIKKGHEQHHKKTRPFCSFGEIDPAIFGFPPTGGTCRRPINSLEVEP